jgi:NitT/TauT family transport system substrate-binding protein
MEAELTNTGQPIMPFPSIARRFWILVLAAACALATPRPGFAQPQPEDKEVVLGITLATATFLPIFIAEQEGFFAKQGLDVKVVGFRGGSDLTRGLVARSVDIGVASPAGVIGALQAGQNVKVFYGGFNQTPFEWYALPSIKSIADLRGKAIGITRFGSSTDVLTRMVLARGGLNPDKDVKIVQGGGSPERLAAMEAGQIAAGPFASPHTFMAADRGYTLLARQSDFMPDYPVQSFFAMGPYIDANPETLKRVLRAFVLGIRFAKANRDISIKTLIDKAGLEEAYAARVYDEMIDGFREDGRLGSEAGIRAFIEMGVLSGEFEKPWPLEAYWVDRFHATYNEWKP